MYPTDQAAFQRWTIHRDAEAFRDIVHRHTAMVYATCRRMLRDDAEAEDVTQECFECLVRDDKRESPRALGPWLHGMAANKCLMRLRADGRRRQRETEYLAARQAHTEPRWDDLYSYVDEAIAELPEELRIPVVAHFLYGRSHAEIAKDSGVPRRTVSNRISKGTECIGESLRKQGVVLASAALVTLLNTHLSEAVAVPTQLVASLGKLALAHSANAVLGLPLPSAAGGILSGIFAAKSALVWLAAVLAVSGGVWVVARQPGNGSSPQADVADSKDTTTPQTHVPTTEAAPQSTTTPPLSPNGKPMGSLAGAVKFYGTDEPVSGVVVKAWNTEKRATEFQTVSDRHGAYSLTGLTPGIRYTLPADGEAEGYKAVEIRSVTLAEGETKTSVDIVVCQNSISGKVWDKTVSYHPSRLATISIGLSEQSFMETVWRAIMSVEDKPLPGVKVIIGEALGEGWGRQLQETVTDDKGQYMFRGLRPGGYPVQAVTPNKAVIMADQHHDHFRVVHIQPNEQKAEIDFSFRLDGVSVTGMVTADSGKPIIGAAVTAVPRRIIPPEGDDGSPIQVGPVSGTTDENGRYRLDGLCPADIRAAGFFLVSGELPRGGQTYEVRAQAEGYASAQTTVPAIPENLVRDARVFMEQGRELERRLGRGGDDQRTTEHPQVIPLASKGNVITGVDLVLEREARVSGRLLDTSSKALPKTRMRMVSTEPPDDQPWPPKLRPVAPDWIETDLAGGFQFAGVPAGTFQFEVAQGYDGTQKARNEPLELSAGAVINDVEVVVEAKADRGDVAGRVLDASNRQPIKEVSIWVARVDSPLESTPLTGSMTKDEAAGSFVIKGISPGTATLQVSAPGYAKEEVQVEVASGQTRTLNVDLTREGILQGYVTRNGEPCAHGSITLSLPEGVYGSSGPPYAHINEQGYYEVKGLKAGDHQVNAFIWLREDALHSAQAVDHAVAKVESGKSTRLDFQFDGSGAIRGVFTGPDGQSWKVRVLEGSAEVTSSPDVSPLDNQRSRAVAWKIEKSGQYEIGSLPAGVYTVIGSCSTKEKTTHERAVVISVGEGETAEVNFDFGNR